VTLYLEEYRCGCVAEARVKKDLRGHCKTHRHARKGLYVIQNGLLVKIELTVKKEKKK